MADGWTYEIMSGQHLRTTLTLVEHNPQARAVVQMPENTARCKIMAGRRTIKEKT
jgi:hypothetical protein